MVRFRQREREQIAADRLKSKKKTRVKLRVTRAFAYFGRGGGDACCRCCRGPLAGLLGVGRGIVIVPVSYQFLAAMEINANPCMQVVVATSPTTIIATFIISARVVMTGEGHSTQLF